MALKGYKLALQADQDLVDIYDFGNYKFGANQANKYLLKLDVCFLKLVEIPRIGKSRNEIKQGLRSFPIDSHVIFYRIMTDHIRIVRVLHCSRDIPKLFE